MTRSATTVPAAEDVSARVLLFTGEGGVGKTTEAAATAVHGARRGVKTLVRSIHPAHSLADAVGMPLGAEPTDVEPGLFGLHVDPRARLRTHSRRVQTTSSRLWTSSASTRPRPRR